MCSSFQSASPCQHQLCAGCAGLMSGTPQMLTKVLPYNDRIAAANGEFAHCQMAPVQGDKACWSRSLVQVDGGAGCGILLSCLTSCWRAKINTDRYMPASCLLFPSERCSCAWSKGSSVPLLCPWTALGTRAPLTNNIQSAPPCKSDQSGAELRIASCMGKVSNLSRKHSKVHFLIRE